MKHEENIYSLESLQRHFWIEEESCKREKKEDELVDSKANAIEDLEPKNINNK